MVRQGPVVSRVSVALAVGLAVNLAGLVAAEDPAPTPAPAAKSAEPIDRLPYRIRVVFAVDPAARVDARRREALVTDWLTFVRRFVGAPWEVTVADDDPLFALATGLEALEPEPFAARSEGFDKVWLIRVSPEGSGLAFSGREFDVATGRLGPLQRRSAPVVRDAARVLFLFSRDLFAPYAEVGERFGKDVALTVRGASVPAASPVGRVVAVGTVFQPLRVVPRKAGKPVVREIPYTFLRVEAAEGSGARCSVVSVYSDPFTKRVVQKTSLSALGVKPGKSPTRLRFQTLPDRAPAAGYVLTVRDYPDGLPRAVGTTDRQGRVTLDPAVADGLLVVRLLAGSAEPMIEFPLMPGDTAAERTVPAFDPKPLTVTLETQLDSLRDAVIDLVAVRARLEARLKARFDGEDWAGAEAALKEFRALTPREALADRLARLKDDAARQQARTKAPVLTKTAQAQVADLQAMIDRYLDDDVFKGFSDALAQVKPGPAATSKSSAR